MAEMIMIEDAKGAISWECSACKSIIKDKCGFEDKVKICPKCKDQITHFYSLFDGNGDCINANS